MRRIILLVGALTAAALAAAVANYLTERRLGTQFGAQLGVFMNLAMLVLQLAMYLIVRSPRVEDRRVMDATLVWEIAMCATVSLLGTWIVWEEQQIIPRVTWASLIIVSVPLVVPSPPRRLLIASVVAAATVPAALLALRTTGAIAAKPSDILGAVVSPTLAVAIAYVGSRVVFGFSRDLAKARMLGAYQLERKLGSGGMGEVWRATHRLLARPAAIKLIRRELIAYRSLNSQPIKRFEREARVTATLRSPHTVELYDFGIADDGNPYCAMELLEGIDLEALVRQYGAQPPGRVADILRQACHSLGEAHAAGLVHRDVKPANIFLCRYGPDLDFVKVLDFGLVALKVGYDVDVERTDITAEGRITGTPAYMAPEMVNAPDDVDERADIYCLGCVAYWLLTGSPVFEGATVVEVIAHHLKTEPTPLRDAAEYAIPDAMQRVVEACLAKNPEDRPDSAAAVSGQLADLAPDPAWSPALREVWWEDHLASRPISTAPIQAPTVTAQKRAPGIAPR